MPRASGAASVENRGHSPPHRRQISRRPPLRPQTPAPPQPRGPRPPPKTHSSRRPSPKTHAPPPPKTHASRRPPHTRASRRPQTAVNRAPRPRRASTCAAELSRTRCSATCPRRHPSAGQRDDTSSRPPPPRVPDWLVLGLLCLCPCHRSNSEPQHDPPACPLDCHRSHSEHRRDNPARPHSEPPLDNPTRPLDPCSLGHASHSEHRHTPAPCQAQANSPAGHRRFG